MGDFRIEVDATGGHGCQREVKDGGIVHGCGSDRCPDCITARYVAEMMRAGVNVRSAKLTHWPGQPSEVVDEFVDPEPRALLGFQPRVDRKRHGSF